MTTGRLPEREQQILDEMERSLRRDRRLDRRMRTMRAARGPDPARMASRLTRRVASYQPHPSTVVFLLVVTVVLLISGIVSADPGVLWAFACIWPLAAYGVLRLACCRWMQGP